jgi:hypothetical protein
MLHAQEVKTQKLSKHCSAYVGVHRCENSPGNTIFVIVEDRAAFDLIDLQEGGNAKVLTKVIECGRQYLVFQFWLEKPVAGER